MRVAYALSISVLVIIVGSLVLATALQVRGQRLAIKHQAEVRKKLDEHQALTVANGERLERRIQESRERQQEALELKRKEIALRQEQSTSLRQLVAMHAELLSALRGHRPS